MVSQVSLQGKKCCIDSYFVIYFDTGQQLQPIKTNILKQYDEQEEDNTRQIANLVCAQFSLRKKRTVILDLMAYYEW